MKMPRFIALNGNMVPEKYEALYRGQGGLRWKHGIGWGRWAIVLIKSGEK